MRIAKISMTVQESFGLVASLFEGLCDNRGECKFLGSESSGDVLTLLVGMDRSFEDIQSDAATLFSDLLAVMDVSPVLIGIGVVPVEECVLPYTAL